MPVVDDIRPNVLQSGVGNSPIALVDTDADGVNDVNGSDDDDDDGPPDCADLDVSGDSIDDALLLLRALPDDDGVGVPDLLHWPYSSASPWPAAVASSFCA